jgi:histone H3/H4
MKFPFALCRRILRQNGLDVSAEAVEELQIELESFSNYIAHESTEVATSFNYKTIQPEHVKLAVRRVKHSYGL